MPLSTKTLGYLGGGFLAASALGGAAIGAVGGSVWDYESRAGSGALAGLAFGATVLGGPLAVRGGIRTARQISKQGFSSALNAGTVGAMAGGVAGGLFGPYDSTIANITTGAAAGFGGATLATRLGRHLGPRFKRIGQAGYVGIAHGGAVKSPMFYAGWGGRSFSAGMGAIGAGAGTASSLFVPAVAHAMIGGSRRDKRQTSLNRY